MSPITNSPVKERMRQDNESQAKAQELQIRTRLNNKLSTEVAKSKYPGSPFVIGGLVLGVVLAICGLGFDWILYGLILGLIIWGCAAIYVSQSNKNLEQRKQEMKDRAEAEIRQAYADADTRTMREMESYDAEVKAYSQKVLQQGSKLDPMVRHVTDMFQRMVSHADAGSHMKFIEADFTYTVKLDGISFQYQSRYTNPQDDYNFNRERFRDLHSQAECEGLARALVKMVIKKMKGLYPANSINISVSHVDAEVTLRFKGANANFIPAQNIV